MIRIKEKYNRLTLFIKNDIWRIRPDDFSSLKALLIKQLRIFILAFRGFHEDKCGLRASALTYYSLLSIVPLLATIFGIAKGFGLQSLLEEQLLQNFQEHETVMSQVIEFSKTLLENTKGGLIAGIGILILFWAVIKLLISVESSLNAIWMIKSSRTPIRKLSDFLSIMFIAPLLLIISSGMTVFIKVQVESFTEHFAILGMIAPLISFLLNMLPYIMIWLLFTLIYIVMPNGKIKFIPGFYAAVIAGTLYQITQFIFITFQVGVSNYNAIYGSFAALPLFLIWLQTSWFIVLLGAEISFAVQNVESFEFEADSKNISAHHKKLLSLYIAHLVITNFKNGKKALSAPEIAEKLEIPIRLVKNILFELTESGLFSKLCAEKDEEEAYQPSSDIHHYTIKYVLESLDNRGSQAIPAKQNSDYNELSKSLEIISQLIENSPVNKPLGDI